MIFGRKKKANRVNEQKFLSLTSLTGDSIVVSVDRQGTSIIVASKRGAIKSSVMLNNEMRQALAVCLE